MKIIKIACKVFNYIEDFSSDIQKKIGQAQLFVLTCLFTHRLPQIESATNRMKTL